MMPPLASAKKPRYANVLYRNRAMRDFVTGKGFVDTFRMHIVTFDKGFEMKGLDKLEAD